MVNSQYSKMSIHTNKIASLLPRCVQRHFGRPFFETVFQKSFLEQLQPLVLLPISRTSAGSVLELLKLSIGDFIEALKIQIVFMFSVRPTLRRCYSSNHPSFNSSTSQKDIILYVGHQTLCSRIIKNPFSRCVTHLQS